MKKIIPQQYFDCLKLSGYVVPRNEKTGEVIPFTVGKAYTISNDKGETVKARCTQNCPYHLVLVK